MSSVGLLFNIVTICLIQFLLPLNRLGYQRIQDGWLEFMPSKNVCFIHWFLLSFWCLSESSELGHGFCCYDSNESEDLEALLHSRCIVSADVW